MRSHHWLSSTHRWHSTRRPGDQYPQDQLPPRQVSEPFYFDVSDFIFSTSLLWGKSFAKSWISQDLFWTPQKFPSLCDPPHYAQSMPVSSKYRRSKHQTIPVANRMLALGSPKVPISRSLRLNDQFVSVQSTHCSLACCLAFGKVLVRFSLKMFLLCLQSKSSSFNTILVTQLSNVCPIIELVEPSNFSDPASRMAPNKLIDDVALPSLRVKAAAKDAWMGKWEFTGGFKGKTMENYGKCPQPISDQVIDVCPRSPIRSSAGKENL